MPAWSPVRIVTTTAAGVCVAVAAGAIGWWAVGPAVPERSVAAPRCEPVRADRTGAPPGRQRDGTAVAMVPIGPVSGTVCRGGRALPLEPAAVAELAGLLFTSVPADCAAPAGSQADPMAVVVLRYRVGPALQVVVRTSPDGLCSRVSNGDLTGASREVAAWLAAHP